MQLFCDYFGGCCIKGGFEKCINDPINCPFSPVYEFLMGEWRRLATSGGHLTAESAGPPTVNSSSVGPGNLVYLASKAKGKGKRP